MAGNGNNDVRITFKAFNQEFNKSMTEMGKETTALRQQMKLQQEQMKNSATETEKLEAKLGSLEAIYESTRKKTEATSRQLEAAKALWGENSEEAKKLERQLQSNQIAEQKAANAITETQKALERAKQAQQDQVDSLRQLENLFTVTGQSVSDFADVLGRDLTRAIQNGSANANQLDRAFDLIARSALGASTDINEIRQALTRLDSGGSLNSVRRELGRLSGDARDARNEMKQLASEVANVGAASAGLATAGMVGLVEGTQDVSSDLAILETQIKHMTVSTGALSQASEEQIETMKAGFTEQETALEKSLANREETLSKNHAQQQKALDKQLQNEYDAVSKSYDQQQKALEKKLSADYDATVKVYEQKQKELEKRLSAETDALSKNQQEQLRDLEKAQQEELKIFEKNSQEKIKLIDNEYKERLKLIDEEKYNQLKALDDQINAINAKTEAEDKVIKERENAQKRAELSLKASNAKTSADRQNALRELQNFDEKLRLEKIREERKEQIDALKGQKDAVKETSDAKKEALKNETDDRKGQLTAQIANEKEALKSNIDERKNQLKDAQAAEKVALQERQNAEKEAFQQRKQEELKELGESNKAQIEALKEVNDARLEALKEDQQKRKEALSERLSAELKAVKESHQAELESFKSMNAEKLKTAEEPVQSNSTEKVNVDLELGNLKKVRTNFSSVRQDVDQITEAMGNLIRAGYTSEEQLTAVSEVLAGAIISGGDTFNVEGLAESIATTTQLGEATGQFMDLLEKNTGETGLTIDEFNQKMQSMNTVTERANYITQLLADAGLKELFNAYATGNPELIEAAEAEVRLTDATVAVADALRPLVTAVKNVVASILEWMAENPELARILLVISASITAFAGAMAIIVPVVTNVVTAFKFLSGTSGIGGLITTIGSLITKILPALRIAFGALTGPVGIAITAITVGATLLIKYWEPISKFFSDLWDGIKKIFTNTTTAIWNFVKKHWEWIVAAITGPVGIAVKVVKDNWDKIKQFTDFSELWEKTKKIWNNIYSAITTPIDNAKKAVKDAIEAIKGFFKFDFSWPKLKVPKFEIKGSINPLDWFDQGLPKIDIQWHAKGGIFNKPTLFNTGSGLHGVGEAGPEAIIPLNERVFQALGQAINDATGGSRGEAQTNIYNYERMNEGATFIVREEADIDKISEALYRKQQRDRKGR